MPVTFGELSTLTTPLSVMRFCALLCFCLSFSLASSMGEAAKNTEPYSGTFHTFCMVTWCLFFMLTLLIISINFIQFHSLLPVSWKNLTATVASLGALMAAATTFAFSWVLVGKQLTNDPRGLVATACSFFAMVAYAAELHLIRRQGGEQQPGYMASVPGLLKVLQVFGGCVALVLLGIQAQNDPWPWRTAVSGAAYGVCLLASLGMVLVMVGDCAARCPVPFDRLLTGLTLLGVLIYMAAAVVCYNRFLQDEAYAGQNTLVLHSEGAIMGVTLIAYTVDLAFSVKLLCDRN